MMKRSLIGRVYYLSVLWLTCILPDSLIIRTTGNTEVDALMDFKNSVIDPNGKLSSWVGSNDNPCSWVFVTCYPYPDTSIQRVDVQGLGLNGSLVPQLANLTHLQYMEMYDNILTGTIPTEFTQMEALDTLNLHGNQLTGPIPQDLPNMKILKVLNMNRNNFSGCAPASLSKFNGSLDISGNPNLCRTRFDSIPHGSCNQCS